MNPELRERINAAITQMAYGWCTLEKAMAMAELIVSDPPGLCVEIGVYGGKSLVPQAMALEETTFGRIVGIDPWTNEAASEGESDAANQRWWETTDLSQARNACEQAIRHFRLTKRCCIIPARSEDVTWLFPHRSVSILHIDGNHTELASVRDVTNWMPRVKQGGYIWMDDINWVTCRKAISMLDAQCDVVKDVVTNTIACRLYKVR